MPSYINTTPFHEIKVTLTQEELAAINAGEAISASFGGEFFKILIQIKAEEVKAEQPQPQG